MAPAQGRSCLYCPYPRSLAEFYEGVLGGIIDSAEEDRVVLTVYL